MQCAVPENIHTSPMEDQWKFQAGGGVTKAKVLREKHGAKLEFLEGWVQTNFCGEVINILWNHIFFLK